MVETREMRLEAERRTSSPATCRRTASPRSSSRATSTSPSRAAASRRRCSRSSSTSTATAASTSPACRPARPNRIARRASKKRARICKGAIVGTGKIEALVALPSGPVADQLAADPLQRPAPGRQPDRRRPRPHHGAGDPDLRLRRADRKAPRRIPLPGDRRTSRRWPAASARSPSISVKIGRRYSAGGVQAQLRLRPLQRPHPPQPRRLHLRQRPGDRRRRAGKVLRPALARATRARRFL